MSQSESSFPTLFFSLLPGLGLRLRVGGSVLYGKEFWILFLSPRTQSLSVPLWPNSLLVEFLTAVHIHSSTFSFSFNRYLIFPALHIRQGKIGIGTTLNRFSFKIFLDIR
jgi:hypothetical protein